jgi:ankyrin repeat protein
MVRGHERIAERLLARGARRSLLDAVALDDVALVEHQLREGADPNEIRYAEFGRLPMYAVGRGNASIVRLLMDHGASHLVGWCDFHTLLAEAARRGLLDVVRVLVECGADLQQVGKDGRTALDWAIGEGREEIVCYLKQAGAAR